MAHATFRLVGGADQNRTPALNEAAISDCQLIRYVPDRQGMTLAQKLGGWTRVLQGRFNGLCRALWAWDDTNSQSWLAVGFDDSTADGLVIVDANTTPFTQTTITPRQTVSDQIVNVSTTLGSATATISDTGSDVSTFDAVNIQTQISVGGLILFGMYSVTRVDANTYTIEARDKLGFPQLATATVANGGAVAVFDFTPSQSIVEVTLADHGLAVGDTFPILIAQEVGNLTLYGNYIVYSVTSTSVFEIVASSQANGTAITGASGTGLDATVTFNAPFAINFSDSMTISGMNPVGYDDTGLTAGSFTPTSLTYNSTEVGAFVSGGTLFIDTSPMNGDTARYVYERQFGPNIPGTGYGVGGYGTGGYGLGIPGSGALPGTAITATDWTLDNWGEYLISVPVGGGIYQWNPTQNFPTASITVNAPVVNDGAFVAMPQRQIVAWGSTFNGISDPLLIRWCDVNNFDSWIGLHTNQAGSYRLPKGSRIVGALQGQQFGFIWTDISLWLMQYNGYPLIYGFNEVGTGCGLIGRKAAGTLGGTVYWMSPTQFYKWTGSGAEVIPCPVWDIVFQDIDHDNADKIRFAANSRFNEIAWYYPTTSSGGEVARYVKYNTVLGTWDFGALARTAWLNESVLGAPIGASTDTYLFQHETSNDADGQPLSSWFQTGYFVMSDGEWKMFVDQVWPDMKWGQTGDAQDATVLLTFYVTDYPGDTARTYGPYTLQQATQYVTPRFRGRLVSIKIESSDVGSFWRIGAMRYRLSADGKF